MALVLCVLAVIVTLSLSVSAVVVNFPDSKLQQVIRDAIGKPAGDIDSSDLVGLTDLNAANKTITNLEGLQHCTDLVTLNLATNYISDLTPLASLLNLEDLELSGNEFSSVAPLAGLVNLALLDLDFCNNVSDISPLAALVNLVNLRASECSIEDISVVAGLANLTSAYFFSNRITDITPLAGHPSLSILSLGENQITDITPLAGLTGLRGLALDDNPIVDVSALTGLVNLEGLWLDAVRLYDLEPLILNAGLGAGDIIYIRNNHLCLSPGSEDQLDVDALVARGATVYSDPQLFCPESAAVFRVATTGDVEIDGALYGAAFETGAADIAEWVDISTQTEPGDVVELDPSA
ncbi:leucine-rich repeat domain-containing protein, partial [Candidatus Bipolaricaulota bacterium]